MLGELSQVGRGRGGKVPVETLRCLVLMAFARLDKRATCGYNNPVQQGKLYSADGNINLITLRLPEATSNLVTQAYR